MNVEQTEAFLRSKGVTEQQIAGERARLDQGAAAIDELTVAAIAAAKAETAEEAVAHGFEVIAIIRAHGQISREAMDFVQQIAAKHAHAVMHIWHLSDRVKELEAEIAQLRRGR